MASLSITAFSKTLLIRRQLNIEKVFYEIVAISLGHKKTLPVREPEVL